MTFALGMIEIYGVPTAVEVADAMCKAARITFVGYENTDLGRITVLIRGDIGEVNVAIGSGLDAIKRVDGGELLSYHIIARPHENLALTVRSPAPYLYSNWCRDELRNKNETSFNRFLP